MQTLVLTQGGLTTSSQAQHGSSRCVVNFFHSETWIVRTLLCVSRRDWNRCRVVETAVSSQRFRNMFHATEQLNTCLQMAASEYWIKFKKRRIQQPMTVATVIVQVKWYIHIMGSLYSLNAKRR
jgi:hypothetical protein